MFFPLALLSLALEILLGYPQRLVGAIGHPVIWIGGLIERLDRRLNIETDDVETRRRAGVLALALLLALCIAISLLLQIGLLAIPLGIIPLALVASSLLAQRSLHRHVAAVAEALETGGVEAGRAAVGHIVGRDTSALDEAGIARAAIESLAENFSDGVVAPALWLGLLGLPGGLAYKAINTADSMIGHRTPRHEAFGWAAARLDDWVNLPASRLSAFLLVAAALMLPGMSARAAFRAVLGDAKKHRSPNAGWPEAAMAGALGLALNGPKFYHGAYTEDAVMGQGGRREANTADILRALRLYRLADGLMVALFAALAGVAVLGGRVF